MLAVRTPLAHAGVACFDCANLGVVLLHVVDVHLACKVTKASNEHEPAMG